MSRAKLLRNAIVHAVTPGTVLFEQGDVPTFQYGVLAGSVHLSGRSSGGREVLIDVVEPPALTGIVTPAADPEAAGRFYREIADLIGVPEPTVARFQGRLPLSVFLKEARPGDQTLVSRYDGSVAAPDAYPAGYYAGEGGDPVLAGINGPLTSGFVSYARDELDFKTDRRYMLLNGEIARHWNWREGDGGGGFGQGSASATDDLREGLALDPRLHVLIAHGMTDLQTPYLGSRYVISQLPESLTRDRVKIALYAGGHMMYMRPESRAALHKDARAIYAAGE